MFDLKSCWLPSLSQTAGVSSDALKAWSQRFGVRLPILLSSLLSAQNGGHVEHMGAVFTVLALSEIEPLTERSIRQILRSDPSHTLEAVIAAQVPCPWLLFPFLTEDGGRIHLLGYPEHSPVVEPQLYAWTHGSIHVCDQSPDDFLQRLIHTSEFPAVDLQEASEMMILADESFSVPVPMKHAVTLEVRQVLGKKDNKCILLTRELMHHGGKVLSEQRTRAVLTWPLAMHGCEVTMSRVPERHFPGAWALPIESSSPGDTVFTVSHRTQSGLWQSEQYHERQTSVAIESLDKQRLLRLREVLIPSSVSPFAVAATNTPTRTLSPNVNAITQSLQQLRDTAARRPARHTTTALR